MHFLLLLSLAAVSHLSVVAPAELKSGDSADFSFCPILFYGQEYETLYLDETNGNFAFCLKGKYKTGDKNVCLLTSVGTVNKVTEDFFITDIKKPSAYHTALTDLKGESNCKVVVTLHKDTDKVTEITFAQFSDGHGTVFVEKKSNKADILKFEVQLDDVKQEEFLLNADATSSYHDVTGCKADTSKKISSCGSTERCQADGQCMLEATCTVTGSTVIALNGKTASVPDRCAYTLTKKSDVRLVGVFQDRRLQAVHLLDHVILHLKKSSKDVKIVLGQGGKVTVDDKDLTFKNPEKHHDVDITRDATGVTAELVHSKIITSIFFDGYTVQIHMKVPSGEFLEGYCSEPDGPSSTLKDSDDSVTGCDSSHTDPTPPVIDTSKVKTRCEILKNDPFTPCNANIDPKPYIKACEDTLGAYPEVDGLSSCRFLENYARACNLYKKDTLVNWRSKASCSSPKAVCQDKSCSDDEYCAEGKSGGSKCFCRAIFASKYKKDKTFGEPAVCTKSSASVTLVGCLLEENNIDYSVLQLNDAACKGQMDDKTHMVTFNFDGSKTCGTVIKADKTKITYENAIQTGTSSGSDITRQGDVKIDFSCFYSLPVPDPKAMSFKIQDSSVTKTYKSGSWTYTVTTKAYTDAGRTTAVDSSTKIQLAQTIWVEMKTDGLDDKLVAMVIDSCWATKEASPSKTPKYDLIVKGCSNTADKTVKVEANGQGTSTYFSFNMFQFSGSSDVYLHCKLNLCAKEKNKSCAPTCTGGKRRRRSVRPKYEDANPAFITMAWTN